MAKLIFFNAVGAGAGALIGGAIGNRLDKQAKELEAIAETKRTEHGVVTKLKGDILFDTNSSKLKPSAVDNINKIAAIIKKYPEDRVQISLNNRSRLHQLILFVFALLCLSNIFDQSNFSIYQGRDIQRTLELLKGNFIWYGSDLSGGGYTPGPFYYWLMAPPLYLFGSWQSLVYFNIFLSSAAAVLFWHVGCLFGSVFTGYLLFLTFLSSKYLSEEIARFWNPSFLPIFIALALLWGHKNTGLRREILRLGFLMGLALQIHYGFLFLAVGYLIGIFLNDRKNKLEHSLYFSLGVVLPLVPYLIWMTQNQSTDAIGEFSSGITTLLIPLDLLFKNPIQFANSIQDNFEFTNKLILESEVLFWGLLTAWACILFLVVKGRPVPLVKSKFLWATLLVSSLSLVSLAISTSNLRYHLPFAIVFYALSIPLIEWFEKEFRDKFLVGFSIFGLIAFSHLLLRSNFRIDLDPVISSAVLLMGALVVWVADVSKNQRYILAVFTVLVFMNFLSRTLVNPSGSRAREKLYSEIKSVTDWNYETFRSRTFLLGVEAEFEHRTIFDQAPPTVQKPKLTVDGVLAVNTHVSRFFEGEDSSLKPNWHNIKSLLPTEFFEAGVEGSILCILTTKNGFFDVCYYQFVSSELSMTWNNIGSPYVYRQVPLVQVTQPTGVIQEKTGRWIFYLNSCENFEPACSIYFVVEVLKKILSVRVLGDPLTVPNVAPNPAWNLVLNNSTLEFTCEGRPFTHRIATTLGRSYQQFGNFTVGFLTPYETRMQTECSKPDQIALHAKDGNSSSKYGMRRAGLLPFRIEWKAN